MVNLILFPVMQRVLCLLGFGIGVLFVPYFRNDLLIDIIEMCNFCFHSVLDGKFCLESKIDVSFTLFSDGLLDFSSYDSA